MKKLLLASILCSPLFASNKLEQAFVWGVEFNKEKFQFFVADQGKVGSAFLEGIGLVDINLNKNSSNKQIVSIVNDRKQARHSSSLYENESEQYNQDLERRGQGFEQQQYNNDKHKLTKQGQEFAAQLNAGAEYVITPKGFSMYEDYQIMSSDRVVWINSNHGPSIIGRLNDHGDFYRHDIYVELIKKERDTIMCFLFEKTYAQFLKDENIEVKQISIQDYESGKVIDLILFDHEKYDAFREKLDTLLQEKAKIEIAKLKNLLPGQAIITAPGFATWQRFNLTDDMELVWCNLNNQPLVIGEIKDDIFTPSYASLNNDWKILNKNEFNRPFAGSDKTLNDVLQTMNAQTHKINFAHNGKDEQLLLVKSDDWNSVSKQENEELKKFTLEYVQDQLKNTPYFITPYAVNNLNGYSNNNAEYAILYIQDQWGIVNIGKFSLDNEFIPNKNTFMQKDLEAKLDAEYAGTGSSLREFLENHGIVNLQKLVMLNVEHCGKSFDIAYCFDDELAYLIDHEEAIKEGNKLMAEFEKDKNKQYVVMPRYYTSEKQDWRGNEGRPVFFKQGDEIIVIGAIISRNIGSIDKDLFQPTNNRSIIQAFATEDLDRRYSGIPLSELLGDQLTPVEIKYQDESKQEKTLNVRVFIEEGVAENFHAQLKKSLKQKLDEKKDNIKRGTQLAMMCDTMYLSDIMNIKNLPDKSNIIITVIDDQIVPLFAVSPERDGFFYSLNVIDLIDQNYVRGDNGMQSINIVDGLENNNGWEVISLDGLNKLSASSTASTASTVQEWVASNQDLIKQNQWQAVPLSQIAENYFSDSEGGQMNKINSFLAQLLLVKEPTSDN